MLTTGHDNIGVYLLQIKFTQTHKFAVLTTAHGNIGVYLLQIKFTQTLKFAVLATGHGNIGLYLLQIKFTQTLKFAVLTTAQGNIGVYLQQFKISKDSSCICNKNSQTLAYILIESGMLKKERKSLESNNLSSGRHWPTD